MARWRRREPSKGQELAATGVSLALGVGVAAVSYYVVRLLLSREELAGAALPRSNETRALPERTSGGATGGAVDSRAPKGEPTG
jgi:hypothetical protein